MKTVQTIGEFSKDLRQAAFMGKKFKEVVGNYSPRGNFIAEDGEELLMEVHWPKVFLFPVDQAFMGNYSFSP